MRKLSIATLLALITLACSRYQPLPDTPLWSTERWKTKVLPTTPQDTTGDPVAGLDYLIHGDYLGSGVPLSVMEKRLSKLSEDSLYARNELNRNMPYMMTAFVAQNGAKIVNGNCFTCHSGKVDGELILGNGNSWSEYEQSMVIPGAMMRTAMKVSYKKDDPVYEAFTDFGNYFKVMAPHIKTNQPGSNPAFRLAEACMMHRNPEDLTFSEEPLFELWDYNIATDTPPLWHVKKKSTLYYNGVGRGSFPKLLLQASVLGVPDSSDTRRSVEAFNDVYAWLLTLEAPGYPGEVDRTLVARGKPLFEEHCSGCHGTYADETGGRDTYPNKTVHLDVVKTDRLYADYIRQSGIVDWYNRSWFANSEPKSRFEPTDGYVAPPLDGVWASAPYLHNGSVPTLYELLKSDERTERWTRTGDTRDYDWKRVGWNYDSEPKGKKWTFDTTLPGYGNGGHTFGDKLSEEERWAVVEYLKTL